MGFSDGTRISLGRDDVVVIVGPNNSGKSATLRAIRNFYRSGKLDPPVVTSLTGNASGRSDEVIERLDRVARRIDHAGTIMYKLFDDVVGEAEIRSVWEKQKMVLGPTSQLFCRLLNAETRLEAANPVENFDVANDLPRLPLHFLLRDDRLEPVISAAFREAFGSDLILYRGGGKQLSLYMGDRPCVTEQDDRSSYEYNRALMQLPQLHEQGDGMRSFTGILLYTESGAHSLVLIDEPEAFLHPPQARLLGRMLGANQRARQLFLATHSGDFLRGVLDSENPHIRVVRVDRVGGVNKTRELGEHAIREYWNDPLLRHSNILDGLFHEQVVICEADADNRFFAAILDALYESKIVGPKRPDIMFAHCGGKDRLHVAVQALTQLGVRTAVIADFDILNDKNTLTRVITPLGLDWKEIERDWNIVHSAIQSKRPELNADDVKREIASALAAVEGDEFPEHARRQIQRAMRQASPWAIAKAIGKASLPSGDASSAYERLDATLRSSGLFVVGVGELESFAKTVPHHGPAWVNDVLTRDLAHDPELRAAREFVQEVARFGEAD
ncbi:MAG: ATP-dependent nuclease [Gemmatimonadaceae bacterium]